jgi:hypothetical protein
VIAYSGLSRNALLIVHAMTIAATDFPCLWAEAFNIAGYLQIRLPHKHLPSSKTPFEYFHCKRPTISHLKPLASKWYLHIREEEHPSGVNIVYVVARR